MTDEIAKAREPIGSVEWHSSEEDGCPDVGMRIALGDGSSLWIGEISRDLWERSGSSAISVDDVGWWIVHYPAKGEGQVIGRCLEPWPNNDLSDLLQMIIANAKAAALTAYDKAQAAGDGGERLKQERDAARAALERDRTKVADAINAADKTIRGHSWLMSGSRGSYAWDDDHFRTEFKHAADALEKALDPLRAIAADRTNCPETQAEVDAARATISASPSPAGGEKMGELEKLLTTTERALKRLLGRVVSNPEIRELAGAEFEQHIGQIRSHMAALAAENATLRESLEEGRRAIGDHSAPNDCYATGPLTGDPIRDLVECPACSFIAKYERARAALQPKATPND